MLDFIKEFFKHPTRIGAILPSSRFLAKGMIKGIDLKLCETIVEYGPGTGIFTKELIYKKGENTRLLLIEQNREFYQILCDKYGHVPNVTIVNGSAEHIVDYLAQYQMRDADLIISGLPFASLPKEITACVMTQTKKVLKSEGRFITFQYTLLKKHIFQKYFDIIDYRLVLFNCPPAFVLVMKKEGELGKMFMKEEHKVVV